MLKPLPIPMIFEQDSLILHLFHGVETLLARCARHPVGVPPRLQYNLVNKQSNHEFTFLNTIQSRTKKDGPGRIQIRNNHHSLAKFLL